MKHILTLAALVFATSCFGQEACQSDLDINANGAVDIADFLNVLGLFGDVDSDGDGIWDSQDSCFDLTACNFIDPLAENCLFLDALGECGGYCVEDVDGDGICDYHICGDPWSYQGYDYETVDIGGRCWFAENLRNENYDNGDVIPSSSYNGQWTTFTSGATSVYAEMSVCLYEPCDPEQTFEEYGRLYNWYAVSDNRRLCPNGWNIPAYEDWIEMINQFGGDELAGVDMKTTYGWVEEGGGTNSSGFTGLPGGSLSGDGYDDFSLGAGSSGFWWSALGSGSNAVRFGLLANSNGVTHSSVQKFIGCSVRCIKDSE